MEGVERYKVKLLPYNPQWKNEYYSVKDELIKLWKSNIIDIQHVGSTAVPAIHAKPILDVAIKLRSISKMDIKALEDCGYSYCGVQHGNKNYHLFVLRGNNQISLRHIHCYDKSEKEFEQLTGFRDYLNSHKEAALAYESLKKKLAVKYPDDRVAYTAGKEEFIKAIYNRLR